MSNPAGAPVRFTTSKEFDLDGNALTPSGVTLVTIEITPDRETTPILAATPMTYDVDLGHWVYTWDSTGAAVGIYEALTSITTVDGFTTPRCERFSLDEC